MIVLSSEDNTKNIFVIYWRKQSMRIDWPPVIALYWNRKDIWHIYLPKVRFEKSSFIYQRGENGSRFRNTSPIPHVNYSTEAIDFPRKFNIFIIIFHISLVTIPPTNGFALYFVIDPVAFYFKAGPFRPNIAFVGHFRLWEHSKGIERSRSMRKGGRRKIVNAREIVWNTSI